MKTIWNFLALFCAILSSLSTALDYCAFECPKDTKHTMCMYDEKPAEACTEYYDNELTQDEKDELLRTHNELRQRVAAGKEKRGYPGPQPAASNMQIMTWDDEIATIAQRWANQCSFGHDQCRNVERFWVGQNVAIQGITAESTFSMNSFVQAWYNEVDYFNSAQVPNVTDYKDVGHYTQLVWAGSNTLGCGVMRYIKDDIWNTTYVVCNYGPTGNWYGEPMYKILKKDKDE